MYTFRPWPKAKKKDKLVSRFTDSVDMSNKSKASKNARTKDEKSSAKFYNKHLRKCYHANGDKDLMGFAIKQIKNLGPVFEFGTWEGHSINYIAEQLPTTTIYGFDLFSADISFQDGEDWNGHDFTQDELPKVKKNVILIKGLFATTLPGFYNVTPALIHVDSDNYKGAKSIFESVNIVKGTIIVFDEFINVPNWKEHEYKAWKEYVNTNNVKFEYIAVNTKHQQVAIKIL